MFAFLLICCNSNHEIGLKPHQWTFLDSIIVECHFAHRDLFIDLHRIHTADVLQNHFSLQPTHKHQEEFCNLFVIYKNVFSQSWDRVVQFCPILIVSGSRGPAGFCYLPCRISARHGCSTMLLIIIPSSSLTEIWILTTFVLTRQL